jgi:cytochrome P450 family 110
MTTTQPATMVPPGPSSFTLVDRMRMSFSPPGPLLARYAKTYGDTFRIVTPEETATFTSDPAVIRDIYTADPAAFDPRGVDLTAPIFGLTSLPVSTGSRHKRDRKLLSPPFQSGTMRNYGAAIAKIARSTVASLKPGQSFSLLDAAQSMALDVILRIVYGVEDEAEQQRTQATVIELIHSLNPLVLIFSFLRHDFGGHGPWARMVHAGAYGARR